MCMHVLLEDVQCFEVTIALRERGLRSVELLAGLAAGPIAAWAYPWLRETAAELINDEQRLAKMSFN